MRQGIQTEDMVVTMGLGGGAGGGTARKASGPWEAAERSRQDTQVQKLPGSDSEPGLVVGGEADGQGP